MNMRLIFNSSFSFLLLFTLIYCNNHSETDSNSKEITPITKALNSVEKCDSIIIKIIKEEGADKEIPFPDTIPRDIHAAIEILKATTTRQTKIWMKCIPKNKYLARTHLTLGLFLRNKWLLWHGSDLAEFFYTYDIEHPDNMSHFILSGFYDAVNDIEFDFRDEVLVYNDQKRELEEHERKMREHEKQLRINNRRFVDSIHNVINYEKILGRIKGLYYDTLNLHVEQFNGDTLRYWTSGGTGRYTRERFLELTKSPEYGKKYFYNGIDNISSDVWISTLRLTKFFRRNDTLFLYDEGRFVNILVPAMLENMEIEIEWQHEKDCTMNRSFINRHWKLDGKNYYLLDIKGNCKDTGLHVRYFVDEDLKVVFDNHIINRLWGTEVIFLNKNDRKKL